MARRADQLLLPVNAWFMWGSVLLAIAISLLPWGRWAGRPDVMMVVLVFWAVHQPRRLGLGTAFACGLLMDVHAGALLGQHALAYTLAGYLAISLSRRLLWFTSPAQALQLLPLFALAHLVMLIVRLAVADPFPGSWLFVAPVLEALLWPPVTLLLLAPQRRAPDRDENRPL